MIEKHLYQRTLTDSKTGKPLKAWYFWYYHDGKKVRKSCGQYRRPCLLKRDAQAYIARLDDSSLIPQNNSPQVTLYDFAHGMYSGGSKYLTKRANKGRNKRSDTESEGLPFGKNYFIALGSL